MGQSDELVQITRVLAQKVNHFKFHAPVSCVYNPLDYAFEVHKNYLKKYASKPKKILFMGMNPGPFGMAQTGIPFGEIEAVKNWLKLSGTIKKPDDEHAKRKIDGFLCQRSEVSGKRLWGLFQEKFITADTFFENHFILNYCPLLFLKETGSNITPDKLPKEQTVKLFELCDEYILAMVQILKPKKLVGIGNFAFKRLQRIFKEHNNVMIHIVLHPSPASPAANRGWAKAACEQLKNQNVW